jgi:hypothetical protein
VEVIVDVEARDEPYSARAEKCDEEFHAGYVQVRALGRPVPGQEDRGFSLAHHRVTVSGVVAGTFLSASGSSGCCAVPTSASASPRPLVTWRCGSYDLARVNVR